MGDSSRWGRILSPQHVAHLTGAVGRAVVADHDLSVARRIFQEIGVRDTWAGRLSSSLWAMSTALSVIRGGPSLFEHTVDKPLLDDGELLLDERATDQWHALIQDTY